VFVGYQARGSLGRQLQEGAREVEIDGTTVPVRGRVTTVSGLSAHADRDGLAAWLAAVPRNPAGRVFVTHGEDATSRGYAAHVAARLGATTIVPRRGDEAALALA
jgi:metallo-beta-lactamase family protein